MAELTDRMYKEIMSNLLFEEEKLKRFKEDIRLVLDILSEETKFKAILEHPKYSYEEKKEIIDSIFKGRIEGEVLNLIHQLINKSIENQLIRIYGDLSEKLNKKLGVIKAQAFTSVYMDKEEIVRLENILEKKFNKKVIVQNIIDKSIVGGVILRVNNKIIDGSIKKQIKDIYNELKNNVANL
jgi:F-type H+-transporting ATPase subunit delta